MIMACFFFLIPLLNRTAQSTQSPTLIISVLNLCVADIGLIDMHTLNMGSVAYQLFTKLNDSQRA